MTIQGLEDKGATQLVIPERAAKQLGACEVAEVQFRYADCRRTTHELVDDFLRSC